MITWKGMPGNYKSAVQEFLRGGAGVPAGVKSLGRWHSPGSAAGWHLVEGDLVGVAQHVAEWANLLELTVTPVIEDAEAAAAASKVFGK
jgi:Domain of unknown function (DUF3303)